MNVFAACLLASGGVLLWAPAPAQPTCSVGPRAGLVGATAYFPNVPRLDADALTIQNGYRVGFAAGAQGVLGWRHWQLQPALLYARHGFHLAGTQANTISTDGVTPAPYEVDVRLNYLALPVNLAYAQRADGQGWQVFAGPYLSALVGGRFRFWQPSTALVVDIAGPVKGGPTPAGSGYDAVQYSQRVDAGGQAGLGYRRRHLLLQATYSVGLRNLTSEGSSHRIGFGPDYKNRVFQLSLAYLFTRKSRA